MFGLFGGIILFIYGIIPTLQPSNFGRVYTAYGGIFVISAVIWGMFMDRKKTRSIRSNRISSCCNGRSNDILQPTLDAKEWQIDNYIFSQSRLFFPLLN